MELVKEELSFASNYKERLSNDCKNTIFAYFKQNLSPDKKNIKKSISIN